MMGKPTVHTSLPLGLLAFAVCLAVFKSASVSWEIAGSLAVLPRLIVLDFTFLALLSVLSIV